MDKLKDTSIIIPFYKKYNEFLIALKYNSHQFELAGEVILVIDEPIDIARFNFLQEYNINFVFFMNTESHPWRNPAVVINKGILSATKTYCIIISPESLLLDNSLINLVINTSEESFSVGNVLFTTYDFLKLQKYDFDKMCHFFNKNLNKKNVKDSILGPLSFGSICCTKNNFVKVGGYSESFSLLGWGGEDDDVRLKLEHHNIKKNTVFHPTLIHPEKQCELSKRISKNYIHKKTIHNKHYNNFVQFNILSGVIISDNVPEFEFVPLDKPLEDMLETGKITDYICQPDKLEKHYPIMLLAQCYNEDNNTQEFLNNVANFVDGMIILDDGSDDNTWNLLQHEKILVKVKKPRTAFNDLENRNMLLNILEKVLIRNDIKVDWFVWLDFDERLTQNKEFLLYIRNTLLSDSFMFDNVNLPLFHMWNDTMYNADYPFSDNGLQYKLRLIRNRLDKLPYVLKSPTNLHFPLSPYKSNMTNITLQIKHLSYITKAARERKYELYTQLYDVSQVQKNYSHFLRDDVKLLLYHDLILYTEKYIDKC